MRLRRYGHVGVLVDLDDGADVQRLCAAIAAAPIDAEARPGWRSVLVTSVQPLGRLADQLQALNLEDTAQPTSRRHAIPVVYDGEDLGTVAAIANLSTDEVIARHTAGTYTVRCLGFSRGFPYLDGLDPRLRVPRRDNPRTRVPAGAVAIAGEQAGIYPQTSPGGWQLLGRTPFTVFDEDRDPPALLQPGDTVRFELA